MIFLGGFLLLAVIVGFTRAGVIAAYMPDGFYLAFRVGFLRFRLIPVKPEKTKAVKKTKKVKAVKKAKGEKTAKAALPKLSLDDIVKLSGLVVKAVRVDRLELEITAGGEDPCDAAMLYGYINVGVGLMLGIVRQMRLKKEIINIGVDFDSDKSYFYGGINVSVSIGRALRVLIAAMFWYVKKKRIGR